MSVLVGSHFGSPQGARGYWVSLVKDLRPIYTAADEAAAAAALEDFAAAWGARYPAIVRLWRAHWNEFIPFLAFPPEVRKVIYTTDEIVKPSLGLGVVFLAASWQPRPGRRVRLARRRLVLRCVAACCYMRRRAAGSCRAAGPRRP
jgi:hypothetical protein